MKRAIILYLCAAAVMLPLDLAWLSIVARKFYMEQIGALLLDKPNLPVAAAFYLLYVVGIVIFAMMPAVRSGEWTDAALYGALFGFFAYATYDLTNWATLRGYTPAMALVDIAWGTAVTAVSATAAYLLARKLTDLSV
jgi:uncharacterized membrane protein